MTEHQTFSPVAPSDSAPEDEATTAVAATSTAAETPATAENTEPLTFADFDVHADIVASLAGSGILHPFPIQAMTLPVALAGHDIIGQAKTGTGKTLGFGVPIIQRVVSPSDEMFAAFKDAGKPQALVVVPTRELAIQVAGDLERAGKARGVRVLTVYGGRAYEPQIDALKRGVEIVVGTPGRLLDLAQQRYLDLSRTKAVVLDEADEMLDLGFLPDVEKLLAQTPAVRQSMLFSATMPGAVVALARRYMTQPTHIRAMGDAADGHTVKAITQLVFRAHAMDKVEILARLLQSRGRGLTLIFSRTKRTAAKVADDLIDRGFAAAPLHGDLGQGAREQALRAFRSGKVDVLVATDVAARGIDVEGITHVVNFQCPEDEKTYLHRIGRTGRAGNTGVAVTLVDWDDMPRWAMINRQLDLGIPEPEETYSSSDHLFDELDIPTTATGRLPRAERTRAGLAAEQVEDLGETGKRVSSSRGRDGRTGAGASSTNGSGRPAGGGTARGRSGGAATGGGRSQRGSSQAGRSEAPSVAARAQAPEQPSPNAARRQRNRRRTRGGQGSSES